MNNSKKILFIAPSFFGYANEIQKNLEARGHTVWRYNDGPLVDNISKAIQRVAPWILAKKTEFYYSKIAEVLKNEGIDDVFVIKGESLSLAAIQNFRKVFSGAKFTLYFWDSYLNMPKVNKEKVSEFDVAFTFDPQDAKCDVRLKYRPLFFLEEYAQIPKVKPDIDVLFLGTAHTDRYKILKRLNESMPEKVIFVRLMYLPSIWIYRARKIFDPSFWFSHQDEFIFNPLKKDQILSIISRSRIVVDIERSVQTGLTMRSIEMLGAEKKIITTNPNVAESDFYNASNVAIIDRARPRVSEEFLVSEYVPPPDELVSKYKLSSWLDDILPS